MELQEERFRLTKQGRKAQKCLKRGMRLGEFDRLHKTFLGRLFIYLFIKFVNEKKE